jgi:tetratricopeptide (TPR) repeat protein
MPKLNRHQTPGKHDEPIGQSVDDARDPVPAKAVPEPAERLPGAIPERAALRATQPASVAANLPVPAPAPDDNPTGPRATYRGNGSARQSRGLTVEVLSRVLGRPLSNVRVVRSHDPVPTYAGLIVFMGVWLIALLVGFGAAGVYQGMQDRTHIALDNAEQHKQLAKQYIKDGNIELATAELKFARQFNPKDPEIAALLASLQPTPVPARTQSASQPNPTPAPIATPTLTKVSQDDVLGSLLAQAKQAFAAKEYESVVTNLENLRRVEPGYQKTDIEDMLYTSYLALARQYLAEERWEESVQKFDKALTIRKNDDVALERYLVANYQQGLSSWDADWRRAVDAFAEIVKINPDYLDARARLYTAYIQYGDYLAVQGNVCGAVIQYDQALVMGPTAQLQGARAQATAACSAGGGAVATPQPGATRLAGQPPAPGRTPVPTPSGSGKYSVQVLPAMQGTNDDTGSIRGRVADREGKPIFHLEMVVTSTSKKYQRIETTDEYGFYGFDGLDSDTYTVRVNNDPASISAPVTVGRKVRALIDFTAN